MPGLMGRGVQSKKVKAIYTSEESMERVRKVAAANATLLEKGDLKRIGLVCPLSTSALKVGLTNEWMRLGNKVPTDELQSSIKDNLINVGVVAALLFTLVSINPGELGDELSEYGCSLEVAGQVYLLLSSFALWSLFICVMHSLITCQIVSSLNCTEEVVQWESKMGTMAQIHYLYLVTGFITYIFSQIWVAMSWMKPPYLIASLVVFALLVMPVVLATFRGFQRLYGVKVDLAEDPRFGAAASPAAAEAVKQSL